MSKGEILNLDGKATKSDQKALDDINRANNYLAGVYTDLSVIHCLCLELSFKLPDLLKLKTKMTDTLSFIRQMLQIRGYNEFQSIVETGVDNLYAKDVSASEFKMMDRDEILKKLRDMLNTQRMKFNSSEIVTPHPIEAMLGSTVSIEMVRVLGYIDHMIARNE